MNEWMNEWMATVTVLQVSDGWYTATADVTVNIDDVNDNAPEFEQPFYQVRVYNHSSNSNDNKPAGIIELVLR